MIGLISAAVITVTGFSFNSAQDNISLTVDAANFNYPVQEFRMGIGDTNRNINVSGTTLNSQTDNGTKNEKWYLNYVSSGVYEIVSSESGNILTNNNGSATLEKDIDAANQRWNIVPIEQDFEGYDLYYKIVSNADNNKALTFQQSNNGFSVGKYTGDIYQKYRLNLDGLEGYAANASINGKMKAGTIGGLLGETVFVSNVNDFISALDSTEPKTIVVTANLDLINQSKEKQRIRDNKTIVGSYSDNTIYDSQLRNDDFWGKDDSPSNNIVIRNMNFVARTLNSKNSGVILLQFYGVRNLWVDHCDFSATFGQNKAEEVGKFMWINTPAAEWSDGKYNAVNPDYITISYNYLKNRFWTFAFGSQNKDTSRLHATVMFNKWEECSRRCPHYGNSSAHNYSNYHTVTNSKNVNQSSQVICGEGARVLNENCRFEAMTGNEVDFDKNLCISFKDQGAYTSDSVGGTPQALKAGSKGTALNPKESYGYSLVEAYNSKGMDVKSFCNAYSGCFKSYDKIKYITDSDMSGYVSKKYSSPFLKEISVGSSTTEKVVAEMDSSVKYMFKNVGSGLYMEVDSAKAETGTNVQQWGADGEAVHNTWKLKDAGDGYYYIRSCVGDGKTYYLDISMGNSADGTNIALWTINESDALKFKFFDNGDGSYTIATKASKDKSCIAVENDSTKSGANIIQWRYNGSDFQKWTLETITIKDGIELDTSKNYMIQNVNSGQFLEVQDGKAEAGANVQQWGADTANPSKHNVWHFEKVNWGYYYVYSGVGEGNNLLLQCDNNKNGANIYINDFLKSSSQYFKFVDNEDGTYTIVTRSSKDLSCVEVASADKKSGANVQQWTWNDNNCQKWKLIPVNYILPYQKTNPEMIKGDVNKDGEFNISDVVMLQKWLLAVPDIELAEWKAADLCDDDRLDVFDLCLMKRELLNQKD